MKSGKSGFTILEFLAVLIIVALLGAVILGIIKAPNPNVAVGRNIADPVVGQIYRITAVDLVVSEVIAMPWKYADDAAMTDRRFLLKVNTNICEVGMWFVRSADGVDNMIAPPKL